MQLTCSSSRQEVCCLCVKIKTLNDATLCVQSKLKVVH